MLLNWPIFLFLICSVANLGAVFLPFSNFKRWNRTVEIQPIEEVVNGQTPVSVNGVLYKTFKKYYCSLWDNNNNNNSSKWTLNYGGVTDLRTLLHAHEGWTFPRQDVNLTLVYPSAIERAEDHVITGYQIILFMDGAESAASISAGGLLEDHINFTFICSGITTLSYQFWLYGSERSQLPSMEPINMC